MGAPAAISCKPRPSGQIIVCDQPIPIDWPVINFRDCPDFNATQSRCFLDEQERPTNRVLPFKPAQGLGKSPARFAARGLMHGTNDLRRLQQIIRQVVLHHDGLFSARQCFHVLHDERGLSAHFLIDNDGTLIQTLDLVHLAYHATGVNSVSIGIEICNRGNWKDDEQMRYGGNRGTQEVLIHGSRHRMWLFTDEQYRALAALGRTLHALFPNLPPLFPADSGGLIQTLIQDVRDFSGYLGHYHVTSDKWDPGCLDFARICQSIRGRPTWFLQPGSGPLTIEDDPAAQDRQAQSLVENNLNEAMGGFFPVGPCGQDLVWHGGVHFSHPRGTLLHCPLDGRVVAARRGPLTPIGSCDFVLTEHRLPVPAAPPLRFFLLLFHVEFDPPPPWLTRAAAGGLVLSGGQVALPKAPIPVAASEVLARTSEAGPPGAHEGQVHVEIFADTELGEALRQSPFRIVKDGDRSGRCSELDVLAPLSRSGRTGPGQHPPLQRLFQRSPAKDELRRLAVLFPSEWTQSPEREALLRQGPLRQLPDPDHVWHAQIQPSLWWTQDVAQHLGLPPDGRVWHYHPVTFLTFIQQVLRRPPRDTAARADAPSTQIQATDGVSGDSGYLDEEDRMMRESANLRLEDLIEGWPDP